MNPYGGDGPRQQRAGKKGEARSAAAPALDPDPWVPDPPWAPLARPPIQAPAPVVGVRALASFET
eukprot:6531083-Lingulodinium_polyedra.AAC.1